MKFQTIDIDGCDIVQGSCLQGHIRTTYARLCELFGEPLDNSGDGKVRAEWMIEWEDGTISTIYDWKQYAPLEDVEEWNIGGFNYLAVTNVIETVRK